MEVKKINRNRVFRYINSRPRCSTSEIAKTLGLSMPTVLNIRKELLESGLLEEVGEYESTGGRKAMAISSVKERYLALGIDITADHVSCVLTDLAGEVRRHERIPLRFYEDQEYFKTIGKKVEECIRNNGIDEDRFAGIGISVPGIVDETRRMILYSHALNLRDLSFEALTADIPHDCMFINDANAAALSEVYNSVCREALVYLSLSDTVGGAIINPRNTDPFSTIGNIIQEGTNHRAGEFGHMTLEPEGAQCYCGKYGCVDVFCNAKNLSGLTDGNLPAFFEQLEFGDRECETVWERYMDHLARVVNSLRMAFDCPVIVGGYVGGFIEPYMERLREKAAMLNTFEPDGSYVLSCRYKIEASALGAALKIIDSQISKI
jgi:N-acetylglucosamine repressor